MGEVDLTWINLETGSRAAVTAKVSEEDGNKIAQTVMACVASHATVNTSALYRTAMTPAESLRSILSEPEQPNRLAKIEEFRAWMKAKFWAYPKSERGVHLIWDKFEELLPAPGKSPVVRCGLCDEPATYDVEISGRAIRQQLCTPHAEDFNKRFGYLITPYSTTSPTQTAKPCDWEVNLGTAEKCQHSATYITSYGRWLCTEHAEQVNKRFGTPTLKIDEYRGPN